MVLTVVYGEEGIKGIKDGRLVDGGQSIDIMLVAGERAAGVGRGSREAWGVGRERR